MSFLEGHKWLIKFWSNKLPNLFGAFTVSIVSLNKDKISQEHYQHINSEIKANDTNSEVSKQGSPFFLI